MANSKIKPDQLADVVMEILQDYSDVVEEEFTDIGKAVATEGRKKLKSNSPRGTGTYKGHYADSWSVKSEVPGDGTFKHTIYNRRKYMLTHLLEYGHAKVNGGRVAAIEHIKPVEEWCNEEFLNRTKKELNQ